MKHLAIGLGIALAIGISLFGIAYVFVIALGQKELLPLIPFLIPSPLALTTTIAQALERDEGRKSVAAGHRTPVYDFRSFRIAWPLMVVYGAAVLLGVTTSVNFVVGFMGGLMGAEIKVMRPALITVSVLVILLASYHIGRWIGIRCSQFGIATMLLVALFAGTLLVALEVFTTSDEAYREMRGWERMSAHSLLPIVVNAPLIFAFELVGNWRGRKRRLSAYLSYLLGVLPPETRDTVVELAYEEAQKAASVRRADLERARVAKV
jgi:hypothetical protein